MHQKRLRSEIIWNRLESKPQLECDANQPLRTLGEARGALGHEAPRTQAPAVRSTLPGTEYSSGKNGGPSIFRNNGDSLGRRSGTSAESEEPPNLQRPMPLIPARQYHLTRSSFLSPSHVEAGHGIRKRKKQGKDRLAVLIERKANQVGHLGTADRSTMLDDEGRQNPSRILPIPTGLATNQTTPLKRPNATAPELEWRARTWNKSVIVSDNADQQLLVKQHNEGFLSLSDVGTLELAEQLHDFSLQLSEHSVDSRLAVTAKPDLKFQPKPPKPRAKLELSHDRTISGNVIEVEEDLMNQDEYVFDTYVRIKEPSQRSSKDHQAVGVSGTMRPDKVGILVIKEEDELEWQEHLEDIGDEKEWDSGDEDENGRCSSLPAGSHDKLKYNH